MLYRANVAALLFCIVCVGLAKPMRGRGHLTAIEGAWGSQKEIDPSAESGGGIALNRVS
jgi:hypothetical protein